MYSLSDLQPGSRAVIDKVFSKEDMKRRFFDMGLVPGTPVTCVGQSPSKDPKAFLVRGAVIAIRSEDSADIKIKEEM